MRHQQAGQPLLDQVADHGQHLAHRLRVQRGGHLVEQDQLGLHRQRAGNRHALLLAPGELARIHARLVGQANLAQQLDGGGLRLGAATAQYAQRRDGEVLQHRQVRKQVVLLEDKAHALAQRNALGLAAQLAHRDAANGDRALLRLQQAGDAAQDGGLARAGRTDDGHRLPAPHFQIDALEHRVAAEGKVHILERYQRRGSRGDRGQYGSAAKFRQQHIFAPGNG